MIPEEIIEEVRLHANIVEVIGEYVSLQRKGKNYLGLCPFHTEKTPSFTVTPDKQIFYCFGCNAGGNVFSFIMKAENCTFAESVHLLARRYSIYIPEKEQSPQEQEAARLRRRFEEINEWTADYYNDLLLRSPAGEPGRAYFSKRGIDRALMESFRLGYAPDRWDGLLRHMRERGVEPEELSEAGLAVAGDKQGKPGEKYYDRFRNRVLFTILDQRKQPVAFGGRVLDNSLPKYLNSPESAFFTKGRYLYGLHCAPQGIREKGFALLTEGYMDVIALHKAGFSNTVASLGTALTREQAKRLRRYTTRVVLLYDSDEAGIQAALRGGEILRDAGVRPDVLTLTETKDPDEFLKIHGTEAFQQAIEKVRTFVEFKYWTMTRNESPQSIPQKAELVANLAADILMVPSPVEREGYERFLSLELGLTLEAVQREIAGKGQKKAKRKFAEELPSEKQADPAKDVNSEPSPPTVYLGTYRAERLILRLLIEDCSYIPKIKASLGDSFWKIPVHRQIYQYLDRDGELPALSDETVQSQVAGILLEELDLEQSTRLLDDCIREINANQVEEKLEDLQMQMADLEKSGDVAGAMVLLKEIGERLKRG